jgi:hypothetical protein
MAAISAGPAMAPTVGAIDRPDAKFTVGYSFR